MAQFNLSWDNTTALANPNAIFQRVLYRKKDLGGAFLSAGFTPANDLPVSATSAVSPVLLDNIIYEFKVQTICTKNGPTDNSNGVIEQLDFACLDLDTVERIDVTHTDIASTITLDVSSLNITKARFTLRKQSDNSIVSGPTVVNVSANLIVRTATGLTASTQYYWQVELYSVINGVEIISSSAEYINAVCGPYSFTTSVPTICPAPETLEVNPAP